MLFLHSLLRYIVILMVLAACLANLRGWLLRRPILVWERLASIWAMTACHIQLAVGLVLYAVNAGSYNSSTSAWSRFILQTHLGGMLAAIALVTAGRMLSKRARGERRKQLLIAASYGIALALMLWATPWPFTEVGRAMGKEWL